MTFQERMIQAAENALIKSIGEGSWIGTDYSQRIKIDGALMSEVYEAIDREKIKKALGKRIEEELAERIMNHLAAEMATDVKTILSNQDRREALRAVARQHIDAICGGKKL